MGSYNSVPLPIQVTGHSSVISIDSSSNMGCYNSVPLLVEVMGHLSVRSIEFTDEEALSWLKRNTILRSREFIINFSNITHLKFFLKKIKCILAGAVVGGSAVSLLGAAAVFAGQKEIVKLLFNTEAIISVSRSFIAMKKKPIFSIGFIFYAAIKGNTNALWGLGIGVGIGGIVGGYYGAKENEPTEAFKNVDKKVSDFISETAAEIVNFVNACKAPEEAEQSPETV